MFAGADVDLARETLSNLFTPISLEPRRGRASLRALVNGLELPKSSVTYLRFGADCEAGPHLPLDFHTIQLTQSGNCTFRIGSQEVPGSLNHPVVLSAGELVRVRHSYDNSILCYIVKDQVLRQLVSAWTGIEDVPPIRFQADLDPTKPQTASVLALFHAFARELNCSGNLLEAPAAVTSLEHTLITSMLFSLEHSLRELLDKPGLDAGLATVRRVEAYLEANAQQPFDLPTLVRETGHSASSIHRAFKRYRDSTPMAFLREVRMRLARRSLLEPERGALVTKTALDCGFTHLGRFAGEYRRRFGETPRQTLRRTAGRSSLNA
jgi:AraC-like DNA-binding protein